MLEHQEVNQVRDFAYPQDEVAVEEVEDDEVEEEVDKYHW